jgi:hypothetical protein
MYSTQNLTARDFSQTLAKNSGMEKTDVFSCKEKMESYNVYMRYTRFSVSARERRLCAFESHMGRYADSLKNYDYSNPIHWLAAGTNVITRGIVLDPLTQDIARSFDGNKEPVKPLSGAFPRIREDTFGAVNDLFHGRIFGTVSKAINIVGDGIADFADFIPGVDHGKPRFRSRIAEVMNRQHAADAQHAMGA